MASNNKIDWISFSLNVLSVILGIVITFSVQGLINNSSEKKDVKNSLLLVKNELSDNIEYINFADTILTMYADASKFLIQYEGHYKDAPADSMAMYCNIPLTTADITHSEEALELLKTSSLFNKIKDLNLSLDIIHTYGAIEDIMKAVSIIFENKNNYMEAAIQSHVKEVLAQDDITAEQLWTAMTSSVEGKQFLRELQRLQSYFSTEETIQIIEETIDKIDKYIN